MNNKVDRFAKSSLIAGSTVGDYISSKFPFEQISVDIGSKNVVGSLEKAFAKACGLRSARNVSTTPPSNV